MDPSARGGRIIPDVAADAAGSTGYFTVSQGTPGVVGGTSAATPLWAGLLVRISQAGKNVGFLTPRLYKATSTTSGKSLGSVACRDITSGSNTSGSSAAGYSAKPGYDACTGWGSPEAQSRQSVTQFSKGDRSLARSFYWFADFASDRVLDWSRGRGRDRRA